LPATEATCKSLICFAFSLAFSAAYLSLAAVDIHASPPPTITILALTSEFVFAIVVLAAVLDLYLFFTYVYNKSQLYRAN